MQKYKNNIIDIANNYYKYLLNLENVNGIGLGNKYINGIDTLEPCINVLVSDKINEKYLSKNNIIPKNYMGIKTDVIKVGKIEAENESNPVFLEKQRPLKGGSVIGFGNTTGTLGFIVTKKIDDEIKYYILSNNHVLANFNKAPIGSPIMQPAKKFGGKNATDTVAILDTFIKIEPVPDPLPDDVDFPENYVDCAIAKINLLELVSNEIIEIGKIKGVDKATVGMSVRKTGFVSGLTKGKVRILNSTLEMGFGKNNPTAVFKDQLVIKIQTLPGDSGSAMVNADNNVIGLHVGSAKNGYSISNDINMVLEKLKVEIYKQE